MGLFSVNRQPRRYDHKYIYYDERKDKLAKIEEKAKRELGMLPEETTYDPERIRGKFIENTKNLKRYKANGGPRISIPVALILIVLLIFVMRWLLKSSI